VTFLSSFLTAIKQRAESAEETCLGHHKVNPYDTKITKQKNQLGGDMIRQSLFTALSNKAFLVIESQIQS